MSIYRVVGGQPLTGTLCVQGAKNSVLPVLAATLLVNGVSRIENCPDLADVSVAERILEHLGCKVCREGGTVLVDSTSMDRCDIPKALMEKMRSSVMFLGPLLARAGRAVISSPGGCQLGSRPIDLHLKALRQMGAVIDEGGQTVSCCALALKGADIQFDFPSVGATENIMMAAAGAQGRTRIIGAAREPEIVDLQSFLQETGVRITGAGTSVITVEGGEACRDVAFTVMPDRMAACTYLAAAAMTGGEIALVNAKAEHIGAVLDAFESAGCIIDREHGVSLKTHGRRLFAVSGIKTAPYPGFPTDAQPLFMAAMATAFGTTVFVENIFERRYRHVDELLKMGANIRVFDRVAAMTGVEQLKGAKMAAPDLRGGAALVLAALGAQGESVISGGAYIARGYEDFAGNLRLLGGSVEEIAQPDDQ